MCPSSSDEAWVAIRVSGSEVMWQAVQVLRDVLPVGDRTSGGEHRRAKVCRLVARMDGTSACGALQRAGIEAAPVASSGIFDNDQHLIERGPFLRVDHAVTGLSATYAPVLHDRGRPMGGTQSALAFGQHTRAILAEFSIPPDRVETLMGDGVVG